MEIHQKERESLAAYIHRFKRKADRCNFNNKAAMIQIFIKGLRNAHFGNMSLQKGAPNPGTCHQGGREASSSTAVNCHTTALIHSKCHVE